MASDTNVAGSNEWRIAGWGLAAFVLILPFIAMKFTSEVNWTGSDFIFAGLLVGGVGVLFEFAVRASHDTFYRAGVGLALAAAFLTIWATGAVGMIGDEGNPLNLMFAAVLLIALLGTALAGFRAAGMARAITVAAVAQILASGIGMFADPLGGILSATYAALWLGSAVMFRKAGDQRPTAA